MLKTVKYGRNFKIYEFEIIVKFQKPDGKFEIKEYDLSIDNPVHEKLVDEVRFNDPSSFVLVQRIMKDCSVEEKDALISIVNKEQPDEFAERYNINEIINKVKKLEY